MIETLKLYSRLKCSLTLDTSSYFLKNVLERNSVLVSHIYLTVQFVCIAFELDPVSWWLLVLIITGESRGCVLILTITESLFSQRRSNA